MKKNPITKITFEGIQIKSKEKFRKFCKALEVIEEECGVHEVEITLKDIFFCPWIKIDGLAKTPMEEVVVQILNQIYDE